MSPIGSKAFPGGVDGRRYRSAAANGPSLVIEPTNPGERAVDICIGLGGPRVAVLAGDLRALAQDLERRAAVIAPAPVPAAGPPTPPAAASIVLADMQDTAANLTARRLGDEAAARVRGWVEVLTHDERWTRALVDRARKVVAAGRHVTTGDGAPRADDLMAMLRALEAVLATPPAPPQCPTTPTERSHPA